MNVKGHKQRLTKIEGAVGRQGNRWARVGVIEIYDPDTGQVLERHEYATATGSEPVTIRLPDNGRDQ